MKTGLTPRNVNDMDDILGNRKAVNPTHVLESSSYVESFPEIDRDLLEKEALDEEILSASRAQKERNALGPLGERTYFANGSDDEDEALAFSKSLFFKNKSGKRKCTGAPNPKSRTRGKPAKKNVRKKAKSSTGEEEKSTVLSFLERAQERDENLWSGLPKQRKKADESGKNYPWTL